MNNTPYISVPEMLNAPTGINWATIPSREASDAEKQAEYLQLTRRGSGWVDTDCRQSLNAALDTEDVRVGGRRCGWGANGLNVITRFSPVLSIVGVQSSYDVSRWSEVQGNHLVTGAQSYTLQYGTPGGSWVRTAYIHGFPNTTLAASASMGDLSVQVMDATGILPGTPLSIYEGVDNEDVIVDASYTSGLVIPLTSALLNDHAAGIRISSMPVQIREAAMLAVIHYVRVRGRSAITVQPTGGARSIVAVNQLEEFEEAHKLLNPYRRTI